MEITFHEHGLNYGGGVDARVLKKLLRAVLILKAYLPARKSHLYFASPRVHRAAQEPLEAAFAQLERAYPDIEWHLLTNDTFAEKVVRPTLEGTSSVADTSELFARAAKLLELSGFVERGAPKGVQRRHSSRPIRPEGAGEGIPKGFQDLVQALMRTLLEEHPTLLDDRDLRNLMDSNYCKGELGLQIANFPLLRRRSDGTDVSGRARFYKRPYAGEYYLCSQFWKDFHPYNAERFAKYVDDLVARRQGHPGCRALKGHLAALERFVERAAGSRPSPAR